MCVYIYIYIYNGELRLSPQGVHDGADGIVVNCCVYI